MCKIIELNIQDYSINVITTTPEIAIKHMANIQEGLPDHKKRFLTATEAEVYLELIEETKLALIAEIKKELDVIRASREKLIETSTSN